MSDAANVQQARPGSTSFVPTLPELNAAPTHQDPLTSPVLTFVLCSRNDEYRGNSRWRLETSLNYLANGLSSLGRENDVEIVVADWGSDVPLSQVVQLSPPAAALVSFLWIPPSIAVSLQKDSPFPEVLALNAAVRRARGEFVGRIDQDTLVGARFLQTFFDWHDQKSEQPFSLCEALMFANRREIPYELAAASPPLANLERFVARFGDHLPFRTAATRPFWSYEVGIWLMHRDLWKEARGYNEELIYFNWMETELIKRLRQKYNTVDLGAAVNYDFYHLGHYSRYALPPPDEKKRKRNPAVAFDGPGGPLTVNDEHWGLATHTLTSAPAQVVAPPTSEQASLVAWLSLAGTRAGVQRIKFAGRAAKMFVRKAVLSLSAETRLKRKVQIAKQTRMNSPTPYTDRPRLSLILLSFNHKANVSRIVERLRLTAADELIICEDGSVDGAREEWLAHLTRPNDFVICSNDLHEIRVHNRAVSLAAGEFVCFLQDDDVPPDNGEWVEKALRLFAEHPRLAILGGHHGYALDLNPGLQKPKARWVFGYNRTAEWQHVRDIPYVDKVTNIPFMFVEGASVGPVFHRRRAFQELSGFDLSYGKPGEPGTLAEHSICIKAWVSGWQVGLYEPPAFEKYVGGQGTKLFSSDSRRQNEADNLVRIRESYGDRIAEVERTIEQLNLNLDRRS